MNPTEKHPKSAETLSAFGFEIFHYPEGDLILNTQLGIDPDEFMQQKPWISKPDTQWFKRGHRFSDRLVYANDITNSKGGTLRVMVKTKSNMMTARLLHQVKNKSEEDSTSVTTIVFEEETGDELVVILTNALYEVTPQNYSPSDLDSSGVDRTLRANASVLNEIMMSRIAAARYLRKTGEELPIERPIGAFIPKTIKKGDKDNSQYIPTRYVFFEKIEGKILKTLPEDKDEWVSKLTNVYFDALVELGIQPADFETMVVERDGQLHVYIIDCEDWYLIR